MKVILFDVWADHLAKISLDGFDVIYFNPQKYLSFRDMYTTDALVNAFNNKESGMLVFLSDVKGLFQKEKFDILAAYQNPFPPEWLIQEGAGMTRVLGCFDDPHATYSKTLSSIVAYHGAYYNSPSFSRTRLTKDVFQEFGIDNTHWFPLSYSQFTDDHIQRVESSWENRTNQVIYVGKCYGDKVDRLALLNKRIGKRLLVFGEEWPLFGFSGYFAPLRGRRFFPRIVRPISDIERQNYYLSCLIGFNLHKSEQSETGNIRMYETASYGMLQICDRAGANGHEMIYEPGHEALFYSSIEEAQELIERCFSDREYAINIAKNGYYRAKRDYSYHKVLGDLFRWAASI
jgi:hypothetical protein